MASHGEITEKALEARIISVLSVRVVSVSQLSKELNVKRYILTGYLEAMKNQGRLTYHKVGKSNCYTVSHPGPKGRARIFALLIMLTLGLSAMIPVARAVPVMGNIYMSPSADLWTGESLLMAVNCTDDANGTIAGVFTMVSGASGFSLPNRTMTMSGDGSYVTTIEPLYLMNPDQFTAAVYCTGADGSQAMASRQFTVSNLTLSVSSPTGTSIYLGNQIELDAQVRKDGASITMGPTFSVTFNGQAAPLKVSPPYDPVRGWLLYLDSPGGSGTCDIGVTATFGRASRTSTVTISVIDPVQFYMSSLDKGIVGSGDDVTIIVNAFDHGSVIPLTSGNLQVKVGSAAASITSITPVSNYYSVVVHLPSLVAGDYSLTAALSYNGYSYSSSKPINYAVTVSGKLTDESAHGVSATMRFSQDGNEKMVLYTDSNGGYYGTLPVGDYDIQVSLEHTNLYLYDVTINGFDDPIKQYFLTSADLPGIDVAGVYVYEVTVPYRNASIEMKYDESKVANENNLKLYRCDSWSTGKQTCYSGWKEAYGFVDTLRNTVYLNTTGLATFALGTLKSLSMDFNVNKADFSVRELVTVRGMVVDNFHNPVPNATVTLRIPEAAISQKAQSDGNGLFDFDLPAPGIEGTYTVRLSAELDPYIRYDGTSSFQVHKSKEIALVIPDSLQVAQGTTSVQDFTITNTGQTDLTGLNATLVGMPSEYYSMDGVVSSLKAGDSATVRASIHVPDNASIGTSAITLLVNGGGVTSQKVFGFTVVKNKSDSEVPVSTTGQFWNFQFPEVSQDMVYLVAVAAISFATAYVLKKRKVAAQKSQGQAPVRKAIYEVKNFMDSGTSTSRPTMSPQNQQQVPRMGQPDDAKKKHEDGGIKGP